MISIITPILNEREQLEEYLKQVSSLEGDFECIVVDGGSEDGSAGIIRKEGSVKLISAPKGRGSQMNAGALTASGDILLFLHVDTRLPVNALKMIEKAVNSSGVVGGCFQLQFDKHHPLLAFYSWMSRFNHSLFTYGDQGLFVKRAEFRDMGMFRESGIMEDIEIQFRLRQRGTFIKLPNKVTTSARRFLQYGIIQQFLRDLALVMLYRLGLPAKSLKRFYPDP